ncbi:MAG: alpha/beta fold hydrolase [Zetaproteobacteria bacterium]|nr:alpha/beta fold hydrolase [Zetaproteobacteria bacterium]
MSRHSQAIRSIFYTCPLDHRGKSVFLKGKVVDGSEYPPVILIHDLGESSDMLEQAAIYFAFLGYSTYYYDLRGHQASHKKVGSIANFGQLASDLLQVASWVRHKHSGRPPVLVGQGVGALIILRVALRYPEVSEKICLMTPVFKLVQPLRSYQRLILRTAADLLPHVFLHQNLTPVFRPKSWLSKAQKKHRIRLNAVLASELIIMAEKSVSIVHKIKLPTFICADEANPSFKLSDVRRASLLRKHARRVKIVAAPPRIHCPLSCEQGVLEEVIQGLHQWITGQTEDEIAGSNLLSLNSQQSGENEGKSKMIPQALHAQGDEALP